MSNHFFLTDERRKMEFNESRKYYFIDLFITVTRVLNDTQVVFSDCGAQT